MRRSVAGSATPKRPIGASPQSTRGLASCSAMPSSRALLLLLLLSNLPGCGCETPPMEDGGTSDGGRDAGPPRHILDSVPETVLRNLPCLTEEAVVVRTEGNVPHIYARTREEAACVMGFVMAQDRFFQMDLTSRLAQGPLVRAPRRRGPRHRHRAADERWRVHHGSLRGGRERRGGRRARRVRRRRERVHPSGARSGAAAAQRAHDGCGLSRGAAPGGSDAGLGSPRRGGHGSDGALRHQLRGGRRGPHA
jgi:hypothetical protein